LGRDLSEFNDLVARVFKCIGEQGDVLDRASARLSEVRSESRVAFDRLDSALRQAVRRSHAQGYLQEPIISQRHGRMVLWVKVERQSRVPGIVHDVSDSGGTLFVEPLSTVSLGNRWQEARLAANREEQRILGELSNALAVESHGILSSLDLLARIDLIMAKGRLSASMGCVPVQISTGETSYYRFVDARHPLLSGDVVPNTLALGESYKLMLITGPNAGGKTVALKTAGLLCLMTQAGLHVPAREATVGVFDAFFADIGDHQSIEQSLSTFSSHVRNISDIFANATPGSLVLIDELGASTEPEEGAALAKAILLTFKEMGVPLVATTHHRDVAAFVHENPQMMNASVELDIESLTPTYRLIEGTPGRSYALAIASRLGIKEDVVHQARHLLSAQHVEAENLLEELQQERVQASKAREVAELEMERASQARTEWEDKLSAVEEEKERLLAEARRDLDRKVQAARKALAAVERKIARAREGAGRTGLKKERQTLTSLKKDLGSPSWTGERSRREWIKDIEPGHFVHVQGIPHPVEVLEVARSDNSLEVAIGAMKARIPFGDVQRKADMPSNVSEMDDRAKQSTSGHRARPELDLRGKRVEEALDEVDRRLDRAVVEGSSSVRIIHGIGTGALRTALRQYLASHPLVKSFTSESEWASDGTTLIELA
jgi:DNA mismatch repair protein MutS2